MTCRCVELDERLTALEQVVAAQTYTTYPGETKRAAETWMDAIRSELRYLHDVAERGATAGELRDLIARSQAQVNYHVTCIGGAIQLMERDKQRQD